VPTSSSAEKSVSAAPWPNSTRARISGTRICHCNRGYEEAGSEHGKECFAETSVKPSRPSYILDEQIGFILRQVWQRHATIFAREIGINLTSAQWAALAKLTETGPCSQNLLGRLTAMDVATIKGVIDRLTARGLTETSPDPRTAAACWSASPRRLSNWPTKAAPERAGDHQGNAWRRSTPRSAGVDGAVEQAG